ncbi:MAG: DUF3237 family protein [Prolixibacteraceae bacterium]|nr:DUF3237 family protein [Prolixibacteraceae bacterium]
MKKSAVKVGLLFAIFALSIFTSENITAQSATTQNESIYKDFKTEHMWDAKVKIGNMIMVGESKHGTRRVIPITGGTFEGPKIKGEVLPGGEDWQLVRPDGDTELNARYLLKTDDGVVIQVINKVLMHTPKPGEGGEPYVRSVVDLEAPVDSKYDYLNHAIFIGTLNMSMTPGEEPAVVIGVYKVL